MSVEIFTKAEFEAQALPINADDLGIRQGEYSYLVRIPFVRDVGIEVRSSVKSNGKSADTGKDSIRCWLVDTNTMKPMGSKVGRWTTRVAGWGERTREVIRQLTEMGSQLVDCPTCGTIQGEDTRLRVFKVKKTGPTKGKLFLRCCREGCKHFQWFDHAEEAEAVAVTKPAPIVIKSTPVAVPVPTAPKSTPVVVVVPAKPAVVPAKPVAPIVQDEQEVCSNDKAKMVNRLGMVGVVERDPQGKPTLCHVPARNGEVAVVRLIRNPDTGVQVFCRKFKPFSPNDRGVACESCMAGRVCYHAKAAILASAGDKATVTFHGSQQEAEQQGAHQWVRVWVKPFGMLTFAAVTPTDK